MHAAPRPPYPQFVDVSALLTALHNFFETLGVDEIRRRGAREDKPLRMVKTILHELCKLKGSGIYAHTGGIPQVRAHQGERGAVGAFYGVRLLTARRGGGDACAGQRLSCTGCPGPGAARSMAHTTP